MNRAVAISEGSLSPTIKWKTLAIQEFSIPSIEQQKIMLSEFKKLIFCLEKLNESLASCIKARDAFIDNQLYSFYRGKNYIQLDSICKKITDGSHQKVERDKNGEIPFLFVSCIDKGRIVWENVDRINNETYDLISRGREVQEGDILFTAVGSYGNAVSISESLKIGFQRHIAYIKPNHKKSNSKFIELWLNSRFGKWHSDRLAIGNAQKTITLKDLAKYPIPNVALEQQNKIANTYERFSNSIFCLEKKVEALSKVKLALTNN